MLGLKSLIMNLVVIFDLLYNKLLDVESLVLS